MKPFYLALDFADEPSLARWASFALDHDLGVKVGLQAFTRFGPALVERLRGEGLSVFLDLKFFDIPNTVLRAVDQVQRLDVDCYTLHAQNGAEVWKELKAREGSGPHAFAVTALTSMDRRDLQQLGVRLTVENYVLKMVERVKRLGGAHFVCASEERDAIRKIFGKKSPTFMCPGIRLGSASRGDQKRVSGAGALTDMAQTSFVIGRTLTEAPDARGVVTQLKQATGLQL